MKLISTLFAFVVIYSQSHAGNLNIVNLGSKEEIKLEIKAANANQQFALSPQSATGIFALPQKAAVLRVIDDKTKTLKLAAKATGRVVVLHLANEDSFKWSVYDSKPTDGKTSLRLVNLTDEEVVLVNGETKIILKGAAILSVEKVTSAPIRLSFENGEKTKAHEQEEPSAVIGFVYKQGERWKIFYVNDT